jgi:hypothetical protein
MIHPDLNRGAEAIAETVAVAERLGQLPAALPDAVVLMNIGLFITLRELQAHLIDQELS